MRGLWENDFNLALAVWGTLPSFALLSLPFAWLIREMVLRSFGVPFTPPNKAVLLTAIGILALVAFFSSIAVSIYCRLSPGEPSRARTAIRIFNLCALFVISPILSGIAYAVFSPF